MTDIYDQATDAEEKYRADAIARQKARMPPAGDWHSASAKWCTGDSCGVRIPDERRRAIPGVTLCIDCQDRKEREERRQR